MQGTATLDHREVCVDFNMDDTTHILAHMHTFTSQSINHVFKLLPTRATRPFQCVTHVTFEGHISVVMSKAP